MTAFESCNGDWKSPAQLSIRRKQRELAIANLRAALTEQVQEPKITGWPPGLLQDDCRGLARWLSSRPDSLYRLRKLYAEQVQPAQGERDQWSYDDGYRNGFGDAAQFKEETRAYKEAYFKLCEQVDSMRAFTTTPPVILQSNAERVPLTDEGKLILFECLSRTRYWEERDYFLAGIDCAERAHNITKGQQ